MCNLLGVMDHHGFELVASVDQSIGSDNVGERKYCFEVWWANVQLIVGISLPRFSLANKETRWGCNMIYCTNKLVGDARRHDDETME